MRASGACLPLVLCAALVSGAPQLLPGGHHLGGQGGQFGGQGATGNPLAAFLGVDFGAGIDVLLKNVLPGEHYNPFLPNYQPPSRLAAGGGTSQPGFIDASFVPQQQQQQQPGFIDAGLVDGPTDLNVNPGLGNSGPKGPLVASCASGLVCVQEQSCDPYTGFVLGTLDRPAADPRQPTVALQRCQGASGAGVCCRDTVGVFQPGPGSTPVPVQPTTAGGTKTGGGGSSNPFGGNPFLGGGVSGGSGSGSSGGIGGGGGGDSGGLGELVACSSDQRCVDDTLCGDDGYVITDGSGIINIRRPTGTFCFTPLGDTGRCCRDRPGSGPTRQQTEVRCTSRQSCVTPPQCDEQGFIITDGAGQLDIRNQLRTTYCRLPSGGKGSCCELRPSSSREVTCQPSQECVRPDLCDENGRIITDGAGLINARFNSREYCLLSSGGRGSCCLPASAPQPPRRQQVLCDVTAQDCVAPALCGDDGYIITDGNGLINPRITGQTYCLTGSGQEGTCCLRRPDPVTQSPSREVTCQPSQECVRPDLCDESGRIITDGAGLINARFNTREFCRAPTGEKGRCCLPSEPDPEPEACGQSLNIRILGVSPDATEANFGELPWQAVITFTNYTFVCGGSLISRQDVLTAAHCVASLKPGQILTRLGEYQVNAEDEPLPHQDRTVAEINVHPGYRRGPLFYDLAVLRLSSPVQLDSHIQPICLPSAGQRFAGRCVASGWGKDAFQSGQFSTILKKVRLPMVGHEQCQAYLRNTRLGRFFTLNKSFVCAGGEEGVDACKGDGGGPLACPADGRYTLAGVTSWGIGCGTKDVPGVYASAEAGLDFIRQHTTGGAL